MDFKAEYLSRGRNVFLTKSHYPNLRAIVSFPKIAAGVSPFQKPHFYFSENQRHYIFHITKVRADISEGITGLPKRYSPLNNLILGALTVLTTMFLRLRGP